MGLAVQQLPGHAPAHDRPLQIAQHAGQNRPVLIREARSDVTARNVPLHSGDAIQHVRRRETDLPQAGMKTLKRPRVVRRHKHPGLRGFEIGPHGDLEAVTHEDTWLDPGVEPGNRATCLRQPSHHFSFSLCAHVMARVMRDRRDPDDDVAWRQADDKPVGVVEDNRVIDCQAGR